MAIMYQSRPSKLSLAVATAPTSTQYIVGDTLNLSGLVVTATRRDGIPVDVTSQCTFSPANGSVLSSSGTKTITITYQGKSITTTVSVYALSRIAVTTAPTKTAYTYGESINYSGIVVKAYANNDNIVRTVTSECSYNPANGTTLTSTGSFSATITWRTASTTQAYSVSAKIYGVQWSGGSSSVLTRTDSASSFSNPNPAVNNGNGSSPFDNILPWSGMRRVTDGYNTLVQIPKFYYKWTRSGSSMKLQICMTKETGFLTSPAHADRGDGKGERDYVYVGAYHCGSGNSSVYRYTSRSGATPINDVTRATARTNIHSYLGTTYWQWDFAMLWTIRMLYLVEYADWNSQEKIGYGCGDSTTSVTGKTDAMTYHTGTNASNRTTCGHVRYRYIEDLWANFFTAVDGIYFAGNNNVGVYIIKNPANFSDDSNGTLVANRPLTNGRINSFGTSSVSGLEYAIYPNSVTSGGDMSQYVCDICNNNSDGQIMLCGGGIANVSNNTLYPGLFQHGGTKTASNIDFGFRLMKLP